MRYGIVSDIHANLQAWDAVLADMKKTGVDAILCLGDVVGYGPDPAAVLDSCYEHVNYFILGNHDAVVGDRLDSELFNDSAKYIIEWTRKELSAAAVKFFKEMPLRMEGEGFVCAHGELALPGRFGYIYEQEHAQASFQATPEQFLFVGHTHVPAKFKMDIREGKASLEEAIDTKAEKYMRYLINVGSVGDPRDGKTDASYCIFDQENRKVTFRKVGFDIDEYRRRLDKVQLPTKPYFLSIYDGIQKEAQTIRDMREMEDQVVEDSTKTKSFYVSKENIEETRTRRIQLNFSTETLREMETLRKTQKEKVEQEKEQQAKKNLLPIIALVLAAVAGGIFYLLKTMKSNDTKPDNSSENGTQSINIIKVDDPKKNDTGDTQVTPQTENKTPESNIDNQNDVPVANTPVTGLLAYEGFDYAVTDDIAKSPLGGSGWESGWVNVRQVPNPVMRGSLNAKGVKYIGNHILINDTHRAGRFLETTKSGSFARAGYIDDKGFIGADGKTLFISFIIHTPNPNRFFEFELHRNNMDDPGRVGGFGNDWRGQKYHIRAGGHHSALADADNKMNFVVLRIDFKKGNDDIHLYLNPELANEPKAPTGSVLGKSDLSFNAIALGLWQRKGTMKIDEIRLGTSYESVTPSN